MKITENVFFYQGLQGGVRRSWSNSVVIKGKKTILIDSGSNLKDHMEDLFNAMLEDGIKIQDIDEFWYTHGHPDHAGSAGVLSKQFQKKIRCHYKAQDILEGSPAMKKFLISFSEGAVRGKKIVRTPTRWRRFALKISTYGHFFSWLVFEFSAFLLKIVFGEWVPALGLEVFDEDKEIIKIEPDVQILFLPGHTPDEVGFWIESQKTLIIGDLISVSSLWREKIPILNSPKSSFSDTLNSLKTILDLPMEVLIPGHGFLLKNHMIKNLLRRMVANMERHRDLIKKLIEENPKIKPDELSEKVLKDLPSISPNTEKRNYLEAILDDIGYYQKYK